jgi:Polysaccharide lyase
MDRRSFLAIGVTGAAALGFGTATATVAPRVGELLWAADLSTAADSYGAGFGNVQIQYGGGDIENDGPGIPVVAHPKLGRALKISMADNQERWEAAPGAGDDCGEGDELYFRVDFVLDPDFPVDQGNSFCLVNQIHHGGNTGSPPIEFDISSGRISVRGDSTAYVQDLGPAVVDTVYKLVYRVKFSADPANSLLEVWLNDDQVLTGFQVPCATLIDGNSYWKGATMYCDPDIPPLTVYQNAHRVGTTFDSVNG